MENNSIQNDVVKLSRKSQREEVVKALYQMDLTTDFNVALTEYEYINEAITGVITNVEKIDEIISANLEKWSLKRLTFMDRAIIRFAVYEMDFTDTPFEIVVNEALNITRKYTDEGNGKMVSFTNKVLDNIDKYLKKLG